MKANKFTKLYLESEGIQFEVNTGVHFGIFLPVAILT